MPLLHVAFKDGFDNDEVVVRVNGAEVFRRAGVSTKNQISYADAFETDVAAGRTDVDVEVVTKRQHASIPLPIREATYVGVSLDLNGRLTHEVSAQPFGYL